MKEQISLNNVIIRCVTCSDNDLEIVQPTIESDEDDVDIDANGTCPNSVRTSFTISNVV